MTYWDLPGARLLESRTHLLFLCSNSRRTVHSGDPTENFSSPPGLVSG